MADPFDSPRAEIEAIGSAHATAVEGFYANYVDALEARNKALLAVVDAGWPKRFVARVFRVSTGRVTQIVADQAGRPAASA